MIRLLKFLITGDWHLHEWETESEGKLWTDESASKPSGIIKFCRCKHCGEWKRFDLD